jgi:hypothetical protein
MTHKIISRNGQQIEQFNGQDVDIYDAELRMYCDITEEIENKVKAILSRKMDMIKTVSATYNVIYIQFKNQKGEKYLFNFNMKPIIEMGYHIECIDFTAKSIIFRKNNKGIEQ